MKLKSWMRISLKGNRLADHNKKNIYHIKTKMRSFLNNYMILALALLFAYLTATSIFLEYIFFKFNITLIFIALIAISLPYNLIREKKLNIINNIAIPLSFYTSFVCFVSVMILVLSSYSGKQIHVYILLAISLVGPISFWINKNKIILYGLLLTASILLIFNFHLRYMKEVTIAKKFLYKVRTEEFNEEHLKSVSPLINFPNNRYERSYYYYKIWLECIDANRLQIILGSVHSAEYQVSRKLVSFNLGITKNSVGIAFIIENSKITAVYFPMNNCTFDPDFNRNGKINQLDLDWVIEDKKKKE